MTITREQEVFLERLRCVRISSDVSHLYQVEDFQNTKNGSLVEYLQGPANENDESKKIICSLVKNDNDDILAYFALRCGLLFDREGDIERIEAKKKLTNLLLKQQILANDKNMADALSAELKRNIEKLKSELAKHYQLDDNDIIHKRVAHTFSGVELSHFCVNEAMRNYWYTNGMPEKSPMGATIFWYFIIPHVLKANEMIGAEYLYIFAADSTSDSSLINHYIGKMHFEDTLNIFAILPVYDFGCQLLCQRIDSLTENRKQYFNDFNPDLGAV